MLRHEGSANTWAVLAKYHFSRWSCIDELTISSLMSAGKLFAVLIDLSSWL